MKVDFAHKPDPVEVGQGTVYLFPSESRPGLNHITVSFLNGSRIVCSCEGSMTPNGCWHKEKVRQKERDKA